MKIFALANARGLSEYIRQRLNSDGGYTFARKLYGFEFPSSISETYYALATLSLLGEEIPSKAKTADYVKGVRSANGRYGSPIVAFYAIKSLVLLGKKAPSDAALIEELQMTVKQQRASFEESRSEWFSADYDTGESPFRSVFCAARALKMIGARMDRADFEWMAHKRKEGGFGVGKPDIASTYYALSSLACAGYGLDEFQKAAEFAERCSVPSGGYSSVPGGAPAFVESTYFAIATLALLKKGAKEKQRHLRYIGALQNSDGGFRRSEAIGISTLSNSYFAVKAINMLAGGQDG